jgi:hypothetical protein
MATETVFPSLELPALFAVAEPEKATDRLDAGPAGVASPSSAQSLRSGELLEPELSLYRKQTIALLQRYMRLSIEVGRLPSLVGREFFRSYTSYVRPHTFEDAVHFVIDVEHCLARLEPLLQQIIARVVLQEYSEEEAARVLNCGLRTVERRLPEALDLLTEMFLARQMVAANE